jgi:ATP-dependent DNA ligase
MVQCGDMAAVSLHAPVALARPVDELTPPGAKHLVWEPKWDGYRVLVGAGRIFSRNGTNLTPLFPDLTPVLSSRLPVGLVLDGEVIAWDPAAGRLDFDGLQARMTAGRRIRSVAARRPAQLVVFDVLAAGAQDLRGRPLRERRAVLEQALHGMASPIVLCQQTDDLVLAREWFKTLTAGGIEGLVIKDADGTYPTVPGQRVWWKVKARQTLDMLAIGFTGDVAAPSSLVLAFPGDVDDRGQPVTAGSTTSLSKSVGRSLTPLLHPTGATFERSFAWGAAEPTRVTAIAPFVVEVDADASAAAGVLRHAARLHRARPDLDVGETK